MNAVVTDSRAATATPAQPTPCVRIPSTLATPVAAAVTTSTHTQPSNNKIAATMEAQTNVQSTAARAGAKTETFASATSMPSEAIPKSVVRQESQMKGMPPDAKESVDELLNHRLTRAEFLAQCKTPYSLIRNHHVRANETLDVPPPLSMVPASVLLDLRRYLNGEFNH